MCGRVERGVTVAAGGVGEAGAGEETGRRVAAGVAEVALVGVGGGVPFGRGAHDPIASATTNSRAHLPPNRLIIGCHRLPKLRAQVPPRNRGICDGDFRSGAYSSKFSARAWATACVRLWTAILL